MLFHHLGEQASICFTCPRIFRIVPEHHLFAFKKDFYELQAEKKMSLDTYVIGKIIGKGSYGEVSLVKHRKDRKQVGLPA